MIQNFLNSIHELSLFDEIMILVFGLLYLFRISYLFLFTGRILFVKNENDKEAESSPLSLIITLRNEEDNLKTNLPKLLEIDGLDYEVIAVDDFSQDSSYLVLGLLRDRYKKLKISHLNQETRYSIKLSQNIALKATSNDWVMQVPVSIAQKPDEWLMEFSKSINNKLNVIIGYSGILPEKGFYNRIYRIENFLLQLKSAGYIYNRMPVIYSEENIAFKKSKYFEMGGYGNTISEPYANLELLINSFIQKDSSKVLFNKEATVRKKEDINRKNYLELLKKSYRIEKRLSFFQKLFLGFDELSKVLFIPLTAAVIISQIELWPAYAILLGIKLMAHLVIIKITLKHLNEPKIYVSSLVYDLFMPYFKLFHRWHFNRRYIRKRWRNKA